MTVTAAVSPSSLPQSSAGRFEVGRPVLPWLVLAGGIFGGCFSMAFMLWTSAGDYALNIGGKPTWSVPAYIPIWVCSLCCGDRS